MVFRELRRFFPACSPIAEHFVKAWVSDQANSVGLFVQTALGLADGIFWKMTI